MANTRHRFVRLAQCVLLSLVASVAMQGCGGPSEAELLESGKALLEKREVPAAIIQFKNALQKHPDSAQVRLWLGKALLESGDPVLAMVELRKAQELDPTDEHIIPALARAMLLVGEEGKLLADYGSTKLKDADAQADLLTSLASAHLVRGEPELAKQRIAQAQQVDSEFLPAVVLEARVKASEGDFDGALGLLARVLAKAPADERGGLLRGEILWHGKKDQAGALASFKQVLSTRPKAVGAHTSTITILTEQGKTAEAKAQFDELKKVLPNHPDTLFFEAQFAFSNKDYKTTREITDRLLKAMPNHPRVLELAGSADYRLKRYVEAEAFLARALKNAPGMLLSRQLLAQTYLRTNQPAKAVEVLLPVIEGKQADGTSLTLAGEAWLQMGEAKKSEAAFALAVKVAPNDSRVRTSAALAQMTRGNSAAAVTQLEAIAAEDKGPRADVALISAKLKQNDLDGALKAIEGLERKTPDRPVAANLRGRVLLLKRDIPGATKSFEAALSKDPNYFPAVASMAAIDLSAGKPDAAKKRFEDLVKAQPASYQAHLALAELASRTGAAPDEVIKHMRAAVKANAGEATPHLVLIGQLISSEPKAGLTAAQEAMAALPNNLTIMSALGRAQMAAGDGEAAVSTFKKLAALQPTQAMHQVSLAEALVGIKDIDAAKKALRSALEIKPDLVQAKRALVSLAVQEKRPQDALTLVREMQKLDSKDPMAHSLEGDIEVSRKNWDAALVAYRTAFALGKTTDLAVRMHTVLRASGKNAEADRLSADWVKDKPQDAAFRYYLGDVAIGKNDLDGAEGQYRKVLELQPRNALAMNNVAWLLIKQNKPGAMALATQANEVLPGRAPLMDTLAMALAADGKLPKAIDMQKAAIARSPSDPSLKLSLAKLLIKSGDKPYARAELEELAKQGDRFKDHAEVTALLKTL